MALTRKVVPFFRPNKLMKKIILSLCLASMLIGFAPSVKAVDLPPIEQITQSEKDQWIQLIMQMILLLQEQLKVMVAQEAVLDKIAQNIQPALVIPPVSTNIGTSISDPSPVPIVVVPPTPVIITPTPQPTPIQPIVINLPTITAIPVSTNNGHDLFKVTLKANGTGFMVREIKYHVISNDLESINGDFRLFTTGGTMYNGVQTNLHYSPSSPEDQVYRPSDQTPIQLMDNQQRDVLFSYYYKGVGKGNFQLRLDSIKYLQDSELKTVEFNLLSPAITLE